MKNIKQLNLIKNQYTLYYHYSLMHKYFIYILTNAQRGAFYIWLTDTLKYRLEQHTSGKIDWFAKKYRCKYLVFTEQWSELEAATARHEEIQWRPKSRQLELITEKNPRLNEIVLGY
jgi:putative endonuclease